MSEARATAKYIRISPRKARQVIDLIRGKEVGEALAILKFTPKRASTAIEKVVKSAAANAEHNLEMNKDDLFIAEAFVDQGPSLKRYNPRAMGRADLIMRRTSHITVVVREKEQAEAAKETVTEKKKTARKKPAAKTGANEAGKTAGKAVDQEADREVDEAAAAETAQKKKTTRSKKEG